MIHIKGIDWQPIAIAHRNAKTDGMCCYGKTRRSSASGLPMPINLLVHAERPHHSALALGRCEPTELTIKR